MSSDGEEHDRLAQAAERLVARIDPSFAGDLPAALDALTEGLPRGVDGMYHELKKRSRNNGYPGDG